VDVTNESNKRDDDDDDDDDDDANLVGRKETVTAVNEIVKTIDVGKKSRVSGDQEEPGLISM